MTVDDKLLSISLETGSTWTKLGRWVGLENSEPAKFLARSHEGPQTKGTKTVSFTRNTTHRCDHFLLTDSH